MTVSHSITFSSSPFLIIILSTLPFPLIETTSYPLYRFLLKSKTSFFDLSVIIPTTSILCSSDLFLSYKVYHHQQ